MEKRVPLCRLSRVKALLEAGQVRTTVAALAGGAALGLDSFSRYENGKTRPPLALVKLFKLLDRRPELFEEVRAA